MRPLPTGSDRDPPPPDPIVGDRRYGTPHLDGMFLWASRPAPGDAPPFLSCPQGNRHSGGCCPAKGGSVRPSSPHPSGVMMVPRPNSIPSASGQVAPSIPGIVAMDPRHAPPHSVAGNKPPGRWIFCVRERIANNHHATGWALGSRKRAFGAWAEDGGYCSPLRRGGGRGMRPRAPAPTGVRAPHHRGAPYHRPTRSPGADPGPRTAAVTPPRPWPLPMASDFDALA